MVKRHLFLSVFAACGLMLASTLGARAQTSGPTSKRVAELVNSCASSWKIKIYLGNLYVGTGHYFPEGYPGLATISHREYEQDMRASKLGIVTLTPLKLDPNNNENDEAMVGWHNDPIFKINVSAPGVRVPQHKHPAVLIDWGPFETKRVLKVQKTNTGVAEYLFVVALGDFQLRSLAAKILGVAHPDINNMVEYMLFRQGGVTSQGAFAWELVGEELEAPGRNFKSRGYFQDIMAGFKNPSVIPCN